ncbi:FAD/NAD(P)-binding oxidoreductase, partial [Mycolicibacterium poriferae]|uniref:FAD/NAD(P)-binding oxidoreductase n=1 Tax=Mycolicibacterium poriferae TaxID=39694 RepID=UPI00321B0121
VRHLVVVGGGFIGSEVAAAASTRGIDVTLVSASDRLLGRSVGPAAAQMLLALHHDAGVHTVLGARPVDVDVRDGRVLGITLDSGRHLAADAVVVGVGARPSSAWLVGSGIDIDRASRAIRCGRSLGTNVAQVWAAGDVAAVPGQPGGHWTAAMESGYVAGANAAGADREFTSVPFAWSNWYGHRIQIVGDTRSAQECRDDDGLVVYGRRDHIVGAVGVDSPGVVARLRREIGRRAERAVLTTSDG